jgi:hypothetical protein
VLTRITPFEAEGRCLRGREVAVLRKKKEPSRKKSILETLMRDMQGTAAQKLVLFGKLEAAGGFVNASAAELRKARQSRGSSVRGCRAP